jgi:hypothetical protein
MDNKSPSMLKSTLVAAALTGVLANVPYVRLLSGCTCCSLVWLCGFMAAYLYSRECRAQGAAFRPAAGAVVGLVAGGFFAVVGSFAGLLLQKLFGNHDLLQFIDSLRSQEWMPPEAGEMFDKNMEQLQNAEVTLGGFVIDFFKTVLIGAVFSTLGGLIGGAVFKTEAAPPPPPPPSESFTP